MKLLRRGMISLMLVSVLMQTTQAVILSPGLEIIAAKETMVKTGSSYAGILFCEADFTAASGVSDVDTVTIRSLPHPSAGQLYLGTVPVAINQSISGKSIDNLKFVPAVDTVTASFHFSVNDGISCLCSMKITDEINYSPTLSSAETVAAWTSRDIRCYGTLTATDPEGDTLCYEVVEYPKKGLLVLTDAANGDFHYTPYVNCSGEDSFTYRVKDEYGNYSEMGRASVVITRQKTKLVFADMENHWAHNAAIVMAEKGIMEYNTEDSAPVFSPDEPVTRGEFLVMVMKTLGVEDPGECDRTVFADDDEIADGVKPYVQAAYQGGVIHGREMDSRLCFCPNEPIIRAETAVILNNIIGAEVPVNATEFTDNDTIPAWAQSALYALNDLGILRGTGGGSMSPYSTMSKAQTAQLLLNLLQYIE